MNDGAGHNTKRIAKNTLLLYVRTFFALLINLYISRVVLDVLGVDDFGIYTVIGGVVAMFSILSSSLSAAISRYITYELGRGDVSMLERVFSCRLITSCEQAVRSLQVPEFPQDCLRCHTPVGTRRTS